MVLIDTDFPGGRIDVVSASSDAVELEIPTDVDGPFRQWFAFRVSGAHEADLAIVNAYDATFRGAWLGYQAMVMSGGGRWSRAATRFDGERLVIQHRALARQTRYAYFATYSEQRLRSVLERIRRRSWIDIDTLGRSSLGRPLFLVSAGSGARAIWIVARQHPGETPASFAIEGLLSKLASVGDPDVERLLREATLYVVPLLNPDGAELGNMRTSATGADLNRAWSDPSSADAPEVSCALEAMAAVGVDLFIDLHADECSPHAFAACSEGNPNHDDAIAAQEASLRGALAASSPDFVDDPFYGLDAPGEGDLSCASGQIGARYDCPSVTLELPIKDVGDDRVRRGWCPERARAFGGALLDALGQVAPALSR